MPTSTEKRLLAANKRRERAAKKIGDAYFIQDCDRKEFGIQRTGELLIDGEERTPLGYKVFPKPEAEKLVEFMNHAFNDGQEAMKKKIADL